MVLQRLSDARRLGHPVLAVVTRVGCRMGASNGLTALMVAFAAAGGTEGALANAVR